MTAQPPLTESEVSALAVAACAAYKRGDRRAFADLHHRWCAGVAVLREHEAKTAKGGKCG